MIFQLNPQEIAFPHPSLAEHDGLLAVGGDLSSDRLMLAYENGIFPWYSEDSPILWYAPLERFVLYPQKVNVTKSMRKILDRKQFVITFDQAFDQVVNNCANIYRPDQEGTWIVSDMQSAYITLHQEGYAHSIEVWNDDELVGGLYGVLVGNVFCGESMFSKVPNTSKAALIYLCHNFDLELIDCQIHSDHLATMGAEHIPQSDFLNILETQYFAANGLQKIFRHP